MHLYDGSTHIGILDPVPVNREGTEVHIEHFTPSILVSQQKLEISKLALVEMVMFVAENFTSVQAISLSLSWQVEGYGDGMRLAGARSAFLQSIGAGHIMIMPKPDAEHMGHFVVSRAVGIQPDQPRGPRRGARGRAQGLLQRARSRCGQGQALAFGLVGAAPFLASGAVPGRERVALRLEDAEHPGSLSRALGHHRPLSLGGEPHLSRPHFESTSRWWSPPCCWALPTRSSSRC